MRILTFPPFALALSAALVSCAGTGLEEPPEGLAVIEYSPAPSVTRWEALKIADAYCEYEWTPTSANVLHGFDPDGIRVDTPDFGYADPSMIRPGWWVVGKRSQGVPYQWGGFDTPDEFEAKAAAGLAAGDVYSEEKRRQLDDAVSRYACGIDCSGFISRCWRLPRSYSTRELPSLCDELPAFDDLLPGDLINKNNVHALLFVRFTDLTKSEFVAYETGSPPSWKVLRHLIPVAQVEALGYRPYRYRNIRSHAAPAD